MFLDMLALAFLAKRYTYVDYTNGRPDDVSVDGDSDTKPGTEDKNVIVARRRSSLS